MVVPVHQLIMVVHHQITVDQVHHQTMVVQIHQVIKVAHHQIMVGQITQMLVDQFINDKRP
nr:hypothetical protein [Leuconostoc citreum]